MKATWKDSQFSDSERENAAAENSAALEEMILTAGQGAIQVGDDIAPREGIKEGSPLWGRDELMPLPHLPSHDNSPGEVGAYGGGL